MDKKRVFALVFSVLAFLMLIGGIIACTSKRVAQVTGYYISSAEDLVEFMSAVNDGSTHLGVTVKQTADIDMSGVDWTPIGMDGKYFFGTYDGCGYTIYNLISSSEGESALFGTLAGTVRNLKIENFNISGRYVSAFAVNAADDENADPKVINCYAKNGTLNGERCGVFGDDFTGGQIASCVAENVTSDGALYACSYNAGQLYGVYSEYELYNASTFSGIYNEKVGGGKVESGFISSSADKVVTALDDIQAIVCLNGAANYSDLYEWETDKNGLKYGERRLSVLNIVMDGSGSENDPYLISDYTDLMVLATGVNLGRTFAGYYLRQTRDFDLSLINNWTPIGVSGLGRYFYGTYDGGGYKLLNIHCERTETNKNNGLFGMLGGTVKNVALVGGEIYGDCTGGIASHASTVDAAIYNSYSSVSVYGKFRSGGIADNFIGRIENCLYMGENPNTYLVSYSADYLINSYSNGRLVRSNFGGVLENCGVIGEDLTLDEAIESLNSNRAAMAVKYRDGADLFAFSADGGFDLSSVTYKKVSHTKTVLTVLGVACIIFMAAVLYIEYVAKRKLTFSDGEKATIES